jgi:hypothetical protein
LNDLQIELAAAGLPITVQIVGVNQVGSESGNENFTNGRDLPWLQETVEEEVWGTWGIEYRDVVLLDGENKAIAVYNLTQNDLSDPAKYDELKTLFIDLANGGSP